MEKINNTKTYSNSSNNNKVISIPLIWIVIPLIIFLLVLIPFNTSAKVDEKIANKAIQSEVINENATEAKNDTLYVKINSREDKEETEEIKEVEDSETKQNIVTEEITKKLSNENNFTENNRIYTASNGETYSIIGKLNIPSLNIKYDILSTSSDALLKISLNKYWGANPNEVGNMVVVGHNYKNNKFFSNLSKINIGDIVKITDSIGQTLDYIVYDTDVIDPYDNYCTSQLTDGKIEITLITCYYENGNTHATKRFIVKARAN